MNKKVNKQYNTQEYKKEEIMIRDYFLKKSYPKPDIQKELKSFREEQQIRQKKRIAFISIGGMASAVLVAILFLLFYNQKIVFSPNNDMPYVAFKPICNGISEVTLQQADGKIIQVDKAHSGQLAQVGLFMNKNKCLVCDNKYQETSKIMTQTLSTPSHKTFKIILSDGTEVWLNAESKLSYPNKFTGSQRMVQLQGEAYFKVVHKTKYPFIVRTNQLQTKVFGTEFNLRNYSVVDTHVTLLRGAVEVSNLSGTKKLKIKPGEDVQLLENKSFRVKSVDTEEYALWKDGYFYFDNVSLIEIAQELGRWYNVGVVFSNCKNLNTKLFFVADRHGSIQDAIGILNSMKKVHISFKNNQIVIE